MDPLEPYYQIVYNIYVIGITLISAYCYVLWIRPFLPEDGKRPSCGVIPDAGQHSGSRAWRNDSAGFRYRLWGVAAAYVVVMLLLHQVPFYLSNVLAYGLGTLAAFLVMCLTDRQNFGQKVFLAVTFFCMRWQSWSIISNCGNWLFRKRTEFIIKTEGHAFLSPIYELATSSYEFWFGLHIVDNIMDLILGAALMYVVVQLMLRAYRGGPESMNGKELLLMVIPPVSGAFAYGVIQFYNLAYEQEAEKSVYDLQGYSFLLGLYSLISYITLLVIVYVFRRWKQEQEADGQRWIFLTQIKDMQRHIAEVERLYSDMRRLRHDMGNHLMTLEQLYSREEYEAAGRYAKNLKKEMQNLPLDIGSGNPVTDVILFGWKKEMEELGVSFTCDFHYPQKKEMDAFDLSVILNNALSNAAEAAGQEKHCEVSLVSRRMKNMYIIEVANTFSGELSPDARSGLPHTTKEEDGHGFGLLNIRHVARKYYGDMEIGVEKYGSRRCCVLRVMLQISA